jgi:mannose-6-phosphate isomerase-like protein (cupin superfamily)
MHAATPVLSVRENRGIRGAELIRSVSALRVGGLTDADGRSCCPHPRGVDHTAATAAAVAQDVRMTSLTRPADRTAAASSATHGAALTFETLVEGAAAAGRMRAHEDTLLRVIAGIVRVTIGAEERLLGTGDEVVIPAGSPHSLASAGGEARLVTGLRPAR